MYFSSKSFTVHYSSAIFYQWHILQYCHTNKQSPKLMIFSQHHRLLFSSFFFSSLGLWPVPTSKCPFIFWTSYISSTLWQYSKRIYRIRHATSFLSKCWVIVFNNAMTICDDLEEALLSSFTDFCCWMDFLTMTYFVGILCTAVAMSFEIASRSFL